MKRSDSPWWRNGFTREWWKTLDTADREAVLDTLTNDELESFAKDWRVWGRDNQLAPEGIWTTWLLLAGRGFGKTRTGGENIKDAVENQGVGRIALVGQGEDDIREVMVEGEALALDTPVPTPSGWTRFGDLRVGDEVFARNGDVTAVAGITPVWKRRPCYAVTVDGSAPILADANHKWVVRTHSDRRLRRERVKTTAEMSERAVRRAPQIFEYELPMHGALALPEVDLPVPPYTLGAWLGDGDTRGHGTFTCHHTDIETVNHIRADGFEVGPRTGNYAWGIKKLKHLLRPAGLLGNKHIPAEYLRASIAQRYALLCGLMDTDGYVSERGQIAFDNTDLGLVTSTRELMLTLGYKPGVIQVRPDGRGFKTMYRIGLTCSERNPPPFRLRRKFNRCVTGKRPGGRVVRSVDLVDSVPVRCIQVEHTSGTFLAGEDFVVTHNSGLINLASRDMRPVFRPSVGAGRLVWPNGATAYLYSAADPESLRGPQFEYAWFDEPMAVPAENRQKTVANLKYGLRLGKRPRLIYSTTPKPHRWLREEMAKIQKAAIDKNTGAILPVEQRRYVLTKGSTKDNAENLPESFLEGILDDYDGTNLGRQEIYAEILGDEEGALWTPDMLDKCRIPTPDNPEERQAFIRAFARTCEKVVIGVDPNTKAASKTAHEAGISVVAKRGMDRFVLDDRSTKGGPAKWARAAIIAMQDFEANEIVAEVNQGGDMVRMVIQQEANDQGVDVAVRMVRASKGKQRRAEPVAAAYERGMVKHLGSVGSIDRPGPFFKLETQMCALHDALDPTGEDFDRCDAAVWGLTRLGLKKSSVSAGGAGAGILTFEDFVRG